jgi:ABC-type phosphate transport system substrate-binding protein
MKQPIAMLLVAAALAWSTPVGLAQESEELSFVVVVNAANPLDQLDRSALGRIFLGQTRSWPGGARVRPIDQSATSVLRAAFCKFVLRQTLPANQAYWQRQILAGRANPPQVRASDADVLALVIADPDGVGYVAASTELPDTVKPLRLVDE